MATPHAQPGSNDYYNGYGLFARVPKCPLCKTIEIRNLLQKDAESVFNKIGEVDCCCHPPIYKCQVCKNSFTFNKGPTESSLGLGCPAKNSVTVKRDYITGLPCYP